MVCYHPLTAYRTAGGEIIFNAQKPCIVEKLSLPCGQCVGCRLERSRQWAIRCVHEATLHKENSFITLTYNDENLPERSQLVLKHWQNFAKRLRKSSGPFRFYHCGEYGETTGRPHYHACLFGLDFPDKQLWKMNNGVPLYVSEKLNKVWGMGYCVIGDVTFESAAYVARYIMKKVNGKNAEDHYSRIDSDTGEIYKLKPEYTTMSRRPGIAAGWFKKWKDDVYPHDRVVIRGKEMRPPKFYDRIYEITNPIEFEEIKYKRHEAAQKHVDNNTPERLEVRKAVQEARLNNLVRGL